MRNAEIVQLPAISSSFPGLPDPHIPRPHFIATLETMLEGSVQMVVIEGEEGIGKTVLAADFALHKPDRTFSFFVSGLSAFSRSPEYLLSDLCDQAHWLLHGTRLPDSMDPHAFLSESCFRLKRLATQKNIPFYFVIDGLLESSEQDPSLVSLVLTEYLPLGIPGFKFLLTGDSGRLPEKVRTKVPFGTFRPPGFSMDEAKTLLADFNLSPEVLNEIYLPFRGVPGKLVSVRRILMSGMPAETLLVDLPKTLSDLFALEWRAVDMSDAVLIDCLAVVAHARHQLTISDVSIMLEVAPDELEARTRPLRFLRTEPATGSVSFVSRSFQQFAAGALSDRRNAATDRIIRLLFSRPFTEPAVEHLPSYLAVAGRHADIIKYLTSDHLASVLERLRSLGPVKIAVRAGVEAAKHLGGPADLLRFSLECALLGQLEPGAVLVSEVDARLALGEDELALCLAESAILNEDRLELLARIMRHHQEAGVPVDPAVVAEAKRLAEKADFRGYPERAISVASDLIGVEPELAVRLLEAATAEERQESLDLALAALSLSAADPEKPNAPGTISGESITERIKSPSVRSVTRTLSGMVAECSVDEILRRCDQVEDTRACVYLLERWAEGNSDRNEAWRVVEYAIKRILRSTDFVATAATFRRLATPLPSAAPLVPYETNNLVQTITAQLAMLQSRGPTVEYVRLEFALADTEATWDDKQALSRVENLLYFIANTDAAVRCEALAWALRAMGSGNLARCEAELQAVVESELLTCVDALLAESAEQQEVLRNVISALSDVKPALAVGLIDKVNTQERRDALLRRAVIRQLAAEPTPEMAAVLDQTLSRIADSFKRDECVVDVVSRLRLVGAELLDLAWLKPLRRVLDISRAPWKAVACATAASVCGRQSGVGFRELMGELDRHLGISLAAINSEWDQIDVAFGVAKIVASVDVERARHLVSEANERSRTSPLPHASAAAAYLACVRLVGRAFAALLREKLDLEVSYDALARLMERVPSDGERLRIWSEIACRCFGLAQVEWGSRIVTREVRPRLESIADPGYRASVLVEAAPALFKAHAKTAIQDLAGLEADLRSDAFANICWFILTKCVRGEPLDSSDGGYSIGFTDAVDILDCLEHIDRDHTFASVAFALCDSIQPEGKAGQRINRDQRAELVRRLADLTKAKLPARTGIQHHGYRIAIEAHLLMCRRSGRENWEAVRAEAETIPNVADRALVLGMLADVVPSKFDDFRDDVIRAAKRLAERVSAPVDRIHRLYAIARFAAKFSQQTAMESLRSAFTVSASIPENLESLQRNMVDLAYRIDADFAESLVACMDDDPARRFSRRDGQSRLGLNKFRRAIGKPPTDDQVLRLTGGELAEFCWMMLGGLHSGRVEPVPADRALAYMERAAAESLNHAYWILAWLIESLRYRFSGTPYGSTHLLQLFDATVFASELAARIIARSSGQRADMVGIRLASSGALDSVPILPGERGKGEQILRSWIEKNRPSYIKVSDPYFTPADLTILQVISEVNPGCTVHILTGERKQREIGLEQPYAESYRQYWRLYISDQDPPDTEIVIAGLGKRGDSPVHERWVLGSGGGLRLGTSFSGLGKERVTEIAELSPQVAVEYEVLLNGYLSSQKREHGGERLYYTRFWLP